MTDYIPNYSVDDLSHISRAFQDELQAGAESSLSRIPNPLAHHSMVSEGEAFQVISIGGTVGKSAIVHQQNGEVLFSQETQFDLPIFESGAQFISFLLDRIQPAVSAVGLNFAYPMRAVIREGRTDGVLLHGTKEHTFTGLTGLQVGEEVERAGVRANRRIQVTVANDTVCLALSGLTQGPWNKVIGGIVGTGINLGYFSEETTIINIESGNFDKFPQTDTGRIIDAASAQPGVHRFEKEISGAYLYRHYNEAVRIHNLTLRPLSSTLEMYSITPADETAYEMATALFRRSASLVAAQLAGLYHHMRQESLTCVMEGSLFWDNRTYRHTVEDFLSGLGIQKDKITCIHLKNSNLLGAAHLVLR